MCTETMCVVWDSVTETIIGPFNSYEDAQMFVLLASDITAELTIEPVTEPQEWAMDNSVPGALFSTMEAN